MKSVEGKARLQTQTQELQNQKNAAKIFIHPTTLYESGLQAGQLCTIECNGKPPHEAIGWPTPEKGTAKNVVLLSRALLKLADISLQDTIRVVSDAGAVPDADAVVIRDITPDIPPIAQVDRDHWAYSIKGRFNVAEYIFSGMELKDLTLYGPKRSFLVESVNGCKRSVAKYHHSTEAQWVDKVTEATTAPGKLEVTSVPGMKAQLDDLNFFFGSFDVTFDPEEDPPPSCGIVIEGSRGTGKSMLLEQIAATRWGKVVRVNGADKPPAIQEHFSNAIDQQKPCIILVDDIKELLGKDKPNRSGAIKAITDGLYDLAALTLQQRKRPQVVVVATCHNYLDDIPLSLQDRRSLKRHVTLPIPDAPARRDILHYHKPNFPPNDFQRYLSDLGDRTHAYTGKDLRELLDCAFEASKRRMGGYAKKGPLSWEDIKYALDKVHPTAMHDINLQPPTVRWSDIGGYQEVKDTLQRVLRRPVAGEKRRFKPSKGVLLYGPPGCSKTMTAQAMATESGFNFFSVKGGELLNMYVGETERSIRNLFQRARDAAPSIIFFDEIDSIAGSGSPGGRGTTGGGVTQALTTLLTEMDGFEQMGNIFVLAATNKPEALDTALLRPGRFDEVVYVPLPDEKAREAILHNKSRELDFPDMDIAKLAKDTNGYSGAEISRICDKAFMTLEDGTVDGMKVMETAIRKTPKGVTEKILSHFSMWRMSRSEL
ncbi:P-loop containing nucleoside triphosphate hydrolase protein [Xylariales sp. AK1849]|nr:P-loop containing nucleoside triphosphate hydrolase protein [Xylariales sp. AK1849]